MADESFETATQSSEMADESFETATRSFEILLKLEKKS
jgi:hypothetical protein